MGFWGELLKYNPITGPTYWANEARKAIGKGLNQDDPTKAALQQGGTAGLNERGAQLSELDKLLMDRAKGLGPSVAEMQGQQSAQQGIASMNSLAASARPNNQALMGREAMQRGSQFQAQIAQQTAANRLQEQQNAQALAAQTLLGGMGINSSMALGGAQIPSSFDKYLAIGEGALGAYMKSGSDRNIKDDIRPGAKVTRETLEALHAVTYKYKDPDEFGEGPQVGIIAQDLERTIPQAVENTPRGKVIHSGRLRGFELAALADMHARLKELEK